MDDFYVYIRIDFLYIVILFPPLLLQHFVVIILLHILFLILCCKQFLLFLVYSCVVFLHLFYVNTFNNYLQYFAVTSTGIAS
jgi:hypothetical protein